CAFLVGILGCSGNKTLVRKMSANKKLKSFEATSQPAPEALVSEVYDVLLRAGRKDLHKLLALFVKCSPVSVLETIRTEAIKLGVLRQFKSRFQVLNPCTTSRLNSFLEDGKC